MKETATDRSTVTGVATLLHIIICCRLLKVLKDDNRAIFQAAAQAQRAVDFLHGLQQGDPHTPPHDRRETQ